MLDKAGEDESQHGVGSWQQDLGLRFERLRLEAMLEGRLPLFFCNLNIRLASCVDAVGEPPQRLCLVDGALYVVAQHTGPVNTKLRFELMSDCNCICQAAFGIFTNLRRCRRGTSRPYGMVKRFGRDHRAFQTVPSERVLDAADNLILSWRKQVAGWNYIRIMCTPIRDANLAVFLNDLLKCHGRPHGSMKYSLPLVGGGPLWAGDEVTPPHFRRVTTAACSRQAIGECNLSFFRDAAHIRESPK